MEVGRGIGEKMRENFSFSLWGCRKETWGTKTKFPGYGM